MIFSPIDPHLPDDNRPAQHGVEWLPAPGIHVIQRNVVIVNIARLIEETLQFQPMERQYCLSSTNQRGWFCKNSRPLALVRLVSEPQDFLWPSLDLGEGFVPLDHQILVKSKYLAIHTFAELFEEPWIVISDHKRGIYILDYISFFCIVNLHWVSRVLVTCCHTSHPRLTALTWILTSNNGQHCRWRLIREMG